MSKLIDLDPSLRIEAKTALSHKFFDSISKTSILKKCGSKSSLNQQIQEDEATKQREHAMDIEPLNTAPNVNSNNNKKLLTNNHETSNSLLTNITFLDKVQCQNTLYINKTIPYGKSKPICDERMRKVTFDWLIDVADTFK